jgi:hypothetical protein
LTVTDREGSSMDRRRALAAVGTAVAGGLAGCLGAVGRRCLPDDEGESGGERSAPTGPLPDLPVDRSSLVRASPRDAIPAITDPSFGPDWSGVEIEVEWWGTGETFTARPRLEPTDRVVGVVRDGVARAYPLAVLNWHEVVNDTLGGPLLVTYCPLCRSSVVAERTVAGRPTTFGVSGLLFRSNLVLYDRPTDSLWSQIAATAIHGPRTGDGLSVLPSELTTWDDWRERHPEGVVLLPPPRSRTVEGTEPRPYPRDPYAGYEDSQRVGVSERTSDGRLHPKTTVLGTTADGDAAAYPLPTVAERGAVNDVVGGRPVVVTVAGGDRLVAYDRRVDGRVVRFRATDDGRLAGGDAVWDAATGRAVGGDAGDRALDPVASTTMYWFAWREFHPDGRLYTGPRGLAGRLCGR